jgi:hypothetical protein
MIAMRNYKNVSIYRAKHTGTESTGALCSGLYARLIPNGYLGPAARSLRKYLLHESRHRQSCVYRTLQYCMRLVLPC